MTTAPFDECSRASTQEVGTSVFDEGEFSNQFLGFSIRLPEEMYVLSKEEQQQMIAMGEKMMAGSDPKKKKQYEDAKHSTAPLFSLFERQIGLDAFPNANLIAVAES